MLKKLFGLTILTGFVITVYGQTARRYKDIIFKNVNVERNLTYYPGAVQKKAYLFDLYQPQGDSALKRPLIIWMHGGGFKYGSKNAKGIQLWCKTFAQRGYVCAGINYRLSKKDPVFNFDEFLKASYSAVQDVETAMDYFKKNAALYHIAPDKIILAGNSAGGIIALQAAYSTNKELADLAKLPAWAVGHPDERIKVAAVINFWGAIFDLNWLKNEKVPIVSVLGSRDNIVPPTHKTAPLFGGIDIHEKATALGIPNELKIYDGYSHELQLRFNPFFSAGKGTQKRWLGAGQFAADFLYKTIF